MKKYLCILMCVFLLCSCTPLPSIPTEMPTLAPTEPERMKFHLEFGEPSIVVQGEVGDTTWGHYQFPNLRRTIDGALVATWEYGTDSIKYDGTSGRKVSIDGGKSWVSATGYNLTSDANLMPNGKYFAGFVGKGAHKVDNPAGVFPGAKWDDGYMLFLRDDLPKNEDTTVWAREYDPLTGKTRTFEVTVNWPYAPIVFHPGNMIYPATQIFNLQNRSVITIDNELYICVYTRGFDSTAQNRYAAAANCLPYVSVYVFKSSDCGRTWDFLSQIQADERFCGDENGFCEPQMNIMPDGSVVMLMRSGNIHPCYIVRSTDNCRTWSEPVIFDAYGVLPQMLTLGCGVTIATYGRPGMVVRATSDPAGLVWEDSIEWDSPRGASQSCYYTDIIALDDYHALMIYSHFKYPNEKGDPVKTVLTRIITVVPK